MARDGPERRARSLKEILEVVHSPIAVAPIHLRRSVRFVEGVLRRQGGAGVVQDSLQQLNLWP